MNKMHKYNFLLEIICIIIIKHFLGKHFFNNRDFIKSVSFKVT